MVGRVWQRNEIARRVAQFWRGYACESGSTAAEFALVIVPMLLLVFSIIQLGIVYNNYINLSHAVAAGVRQLSISRGSGTSYTDTITAINNAAPNLNSFATPISGQSVVLTVAGTGCTSGNQGSTCQNAFAQGATATVAATYPCQINVIGMVVVNPCTLKSTSTEYIQ